MRVGAAAVALAPLARTARSAGTAGAEAAAIAATETAAITAAEAAAITAFAMAVGNKRCANRVIGYERNVNKAGGITSLSL